MSNGRNPFRGVQTDSGDESAEDEVSQPGWSLAWKPMLIQVAAAAVIAFAFTLALGQSLQTATLVAVGGVAFIAFGGAMVELGYKENK